MRYAVMVVFLIVAITGTVSPVWAQRGSSRIFNGDQQQTPKIDRGVLQAMNDGQKLIKQRQFVQGVTLLQSVLDHPEDYFIGKNFQTNQVLHPGVKAQTQQILAELPTEGRAAYELHFGTTARALLTEALSTNNRELLDEVVGKYQMTAAGFDAMQALAASAFDHEKPIEAAILCEAIAVHPRAKADPDLVGRLLLRTAFAWHLAGQTERRQTALNALKKKDDPAAWRMGGRPVPPLQNEGDDSQWLAANFGPPGQQHTSTVRDWSLPRGGLTGNESATAACPVGGGDWSISPLKYTRVLLDDESNQKLQEVFDQLAKRIEHLLRDDNRLTQPAAIPIIVGDVVVYRTLNDVTAVNLQTGQLLWRSSVTDGMLTWLLQNTISDSDTAYSSSPGTLPGYLRHKLFRDQRSGSLTSDGKYVYAVEESDSQFNPLRPKARQPFITDPTNKLVAYELEGGRMSWEVGGLRGTPPADLSGIFFLGPPLPYEGHLYCLAEVKNELWLLALIAENNAVRLDWSQSLVALNVADSMTSPRRQAGLIPVIAEGMMICPTASGSVVAFDLLQRQLKWGYAYEPKGNRHFHDGFEFGIPTQVYEEEGRWLDCGPILVGGRVILTPRDSAELHCVNLVDGTTVWKRLRNQGLYVACVDEESVIVVGRTQVVAYSLADASEKWLEPLEIPEPSGRGVRIGSRYLLPLSTGEIATLDLSSGRILGRSRLPDGSVPGNLAVGTGALVSVGIHDVIGFKSLSEVERQIAKLMADSKNAEALALRGELRIHNGDEEGAIDDLRESFRQEPRQRVKRVLAGTMLTVLKRDLPRLLRAASELETLADEPRQRIEFLHLYAQALNDGGDRVGAVKQLFRLAEMPQLTDDMNESGPGYSISVRQSIRSQLQTTYETASSDERLAITHAFEGEFESAMKAEDRDTRLPRFVKLTLGHSAAAVLLKQLAESNDKTFDRAARIRLLEHLTDSQNKSVAGFATATLAQMTLASNLPREARPWIEELGQKFPTEICLEGKTGRQLSDEWLAREDVQQAKVVSAVWPDRPIAAEQIRRRLNQFSFPVDVVTQVGCHFVGWSFEIDSSSALLTARDASLKVAWQLQLALFAEISPGQTTQLHIRGRQLALSSGQWLVVMESTDSYSAPAILFEKSLRSTSPMSPRPRDVVWERHLLPSGRRFQSAFEARGMVGFLIGLSDESVFYQLDNRLFAADAETGRVQWSRIGAEFAKSDATVDTTLILHTADNDALLLRPLDGTIRQRHKGSRGEKPLWFRGTRRLSQRTEGADLRILEMRDFDGDQVVWYSQHPAGTVRALVNGEELAVLEPSGKLSILKLETGEIRLTTELPVIRPHGSDGVLAVQRCDDRYVIVAGISPVRTDARIVTPLEIAPSSETTFTVDGIACAIEQNGGKVVWSAPLEKLAFDTTQPSNLPVLVLASRQSVLDDLTRSARESRLSVLILDKRNGQSVFKDQVLHSLYNRGVQYIPLVDEQKLVVDFQAWNLELTFPELPK